ncbi:HD domain-containing phosphohydrolase [Chloroflexota bacterium]
MTAKQGKVLITDDEIAIRRLLKRRLTSEGYECREAGSANGALDELQKNEAELVILDIKMPGKSGVQLLPEIRAGYPDAVVIMATAITDTSTAIRCMRLGAYDYINKPFDLDDVVLSVDKALEKRRLQMEVRDYQHNLEQKVEEQAKKIRNAFFNAITALAYALEAKDSYTSGHSQRVSEISAAIARELGLSQENTNKIELAGRVHDVGKIGVKESVLNKPSGLTDEEFQHIKYHPEAGERILAPIVEDEGILQIVRHHHERYDGNGYPDGFSGDQIPLGARILAVADSYDAMISERPYGGAMSVEKACAEIEWGRNSQFDPEVAGAFLRIRGSLVLSFDILRSGLRC